jgi:hypothetical protein
MKHRRFLLPGRGRSLDLAFETHVLGFDPADENRSVVAWSLGGDRCIEPLRKLFEAMGATLEVSGAPLRDGGPMPRPWGVRIVATYQPSGAKIPVAASGSSMGEAYVRAAVSLVLAAQREQERVERSGG